MIPIIICGILGIAYGIYLKRKHKGFTGIAFFITFLSLVIGLIIALLFSQFLPHKEVREYYALEALKDGNSISGSFFLGTGNINGEAVFNCYIKRGEYFELKSTKAKNSKIKYTDSSPQLVVVKVVRDYVWSIRPKSVPRYIYEIPKGSIKNNYELSSG